MRDRNTQETIDCSHTKNNCVIKFYCFGVAGDVIGFWAQRREDERASEWLSRAFRVKSEGWRDSLIVNNNDRK
jgi:hypothetical protein